MNNLFLKRKSKELSEKELVLRKELNGLSKITTEVKLDHFKTVKGTYHLDGLLSFIMGMTLISTSYALPIKLLLIAINMVFLFALIHSARSMIRTCQHQNLFFWITCVEKTLPEWKDYRKQVERHLVFHLFLFCFWFLAFISIVPLTIFSFTTLLIIVSRRR